MQVFTLNNLPIYLPGDTAEVPFGDPISGITCTSASPGVITSVGYIPKLNDAVQLSFQSGGSIPTGLLVGTTYYVVAPVNNTFSVALTKGGAAINTSSTGSLLTLHLISQQTYGTVLPFKSGDSVVVLNLTGGSLVLQGAPDLNAAGVYGNPGGPGAFVTLATVLTLSAQVVVLQADWIRVSTAANLILLQN